MRLSLESWLRGPGSVLIFLTLPCDSRSYQAAAQSLGARRPFISLSAPQLSSGPANRDPHTPSSSSSSPLLHFPLLFCPLLSSPLLSSHPSALLFCRRPPLFSIVFLSGAVSHRFHVRCSLTVLNKSFFSVPGGDRAHVPTANHNRHHCAHTHTHTHTHTLNRGCLCVADSR